MREEIGSIRRRDVSHPVRAFVRGLAGRRPHLPGLTRAASTGLDALAEQLLSRRGEVSGTALAGRFLAAYDTAPADERSRFLASLLTRFGVDRERLGSALSHYMAESGEANAAALHRAAEPRRQELFRRLNTAPGGTSALVRMRAELLRKLPDHPELRPVDDDFRHLFGSWFNRGFLTLEAITWETPAVVLERIIAYEAVHEIDGWEALRRRLAPSDRKCFAFFHPQLRHDPLVFVEVALTREAKHSIADLIDSDTPPLPAEEATTAVFYSISNCQPGLRGVSFGDLLIKQVVADLRRELPRLRTFVTLSPVPGFAAWLAEARSGEAAEALPEADAAALRALDAEGWAEDEAARKSLAGPLSRAAAVYLTRARRADGRSLDPVARFHLGNGARLDRVNVFADLSPHGLTASHGVMVNYLYDPDRIEENHESFAERGEVVTSPDVRRLARSARSVPVRQQ